jgi:tripartite-type tricarboxylate transporter receptor subunit TctC
MRLHRTLMMLAALCFTALAQAQYPSRPIKVVVLIAPGGGPDVAARIMGPMLAERLGQPVVIENRAGSNGNIAGQYVARSAPDGYTLLFGADSLVAINPHVYVDMGFDPLKDITPVATAVISQMLLSVNPAVPVKNFKEFLDYARANPGKLNYASAGNGSLHHLSMEMLKQRAGIDLVHVPYKSGASAATAAVAGDVPVVVAGASSAPVLKSGRLRPVAVTGRKRHATFPDVPAIGEFYPGYEMNNWNAIWAPAGTSDAIVAKLRQEINRVLATPEMKERLAGAGGAEPWIETPEEFAAFIRREYQKYGKLVKDIGLKID